MIKFCSVMANPGKKTLSKNISQMKFMQRASLSLDQEETSGSGDLIEKWIAPNVPKPSQAPHRAKSIEYSFIEYENLDAFGRFSYNKFNKEIERLCKLRSESDHPVREGSDEDTGTIPPQEVAKRYEEITSRKFLGKRHRSDIEIVMDKVEGSDFTFKRDKDGFMKPA